MKNFNFYVKEDKWEVQLLSPKKFQKLHGENTRAVTLTDKKSIHFRSDDLTWNLIIHELYHVYYDYLHSESENLEEIEETNARMLANDFHHILRKALTIFNRLNKMVKIQTPLPFKPEKFISLLEGLKN